ncbi:PAS domain-containing protein [Aureimonas flava]|uniref:PAS domain-containing protein n=2 Tax=Aureimonas flava TaxID=2320271 RepID=A0A3A1WMS9_9HYPH|nr:PAS domain-containing protein [Aureimonas flava]
MGASFLARTLDLLEQARSLQQLVGEQRAIIDHISDGLLVLRRDGVLRHVNAPGARMLNLDPAAAVGRPFRDLVDFEPHIMPIFASGQGYTDRELRVRTGTVDIHILDTAVPILGEDGTVVSIVNTFHEMTRAKRLSNRLAGDRARYRFSDVVGQSPLMREAVAVAERAARSDAGVLLYGESGTGKEVFAQSIHNASRRANGPFVAVNCAALPRDLIESEMFGYTPGSFTGADRAGRLGRFELAAGGTIFLDEISEMPLDVQAKLLRVLQERQVTRIGAAASVGVDVRVVAAANRDLGEMVENRAFREDLYYRLNVMRIDLPPLRRRRDDIPALALDAIRRSCALLHRPALHLSAKAMRQLASYGWPGNVRQLQNVIERLVNMTDADEVDELPADWLPASEAEGGAAAGAPLSGAAVETLEDAERRAVGAALEAFGFNLTRTAEALGIARPTLYAKIRKFGYPANGRAARAGPGG